MSEHRERSDHARSAREALVGTTIAGRYRLLAVVGHGGMGAVYEAEHLGIGKRVAIKFIDQEFATDERVVARFAREVRAMSAVDSPHIVTVFDAGAEAGRPYLVMELLRGEDLGERLRRAHRLGVAEALRITAQVLRGLAKAHAAGIIHRDLKPDNVFLVKDNAAVLAKIVDFGVSKIERPRDRTSPLALTGRGTVLGTPFYMSPEQAQAMPDLDVRADIYSVGAMLFECLSGRPPHTGETYEQVILSICMRDAPDLRAIDATISAGVAEFVARALSRERLDRYGSAERMLAALGEIAPDEKTRARIDFVATPTVLSAGVAPPRKIDLNETQLAGSSEFELGGQPEAASPKEDARVIVAPLVPRGPARHGGRRRRASSSLARVVVTALIATLAGGGLMLGALAVFGGRSSTTSIPPRDASLRDAP